MKRPWSRLGASHPGSGEPRPASSKSFGHQSLPEGGKLGAAIRYALNRWDGLVRYLDDGRIEIDSNIPSARGPLQRS